MIKKMRRKGEIRRWRRKSGGGGGGGDLEEVVEGIIY